MTQNTGRYSVGQTLFGICFRYKNGNISYLPPYLWVTGMDDPEDIFIRKFTVTEHHKVPDSWDPFNELSCDGYVLDSDGIVFHNQYPTASYGQISDEADRLFVMHTTAEQADEVIEGKIPYEYTLLTEYYGNVQRGIEKLTEDKDKTGEESPVLQKIINMAGMLEDKMACDFAVKFISEPLYEGSHSVRWKLIPL